MTRTEIVAQYGGPGCSVEFGNEIVMRGSQRFVKIGNQLYDITKPLVWHSPRQGGVDCRATPLVTEEGFYAYIYPDEGVGGMVCTTEYRYANGKVDHGENIFQFGWIFADEIDATNAEINEHTAEMLDNGELKPLR